MLGRAGHHPAPSAWIVNEKFRQLRIEKSGPRGSSGGPAMASEVSRTASGTPSSVIGTVQRSQRVRFGRICGASRRANRNGRAGREATASTPADDDSRRDDSDS